MLKIISLLTLTLFVNSVNADNHHHDADWVAPLHLAAFGHGIWSMPAPSQGYLFLAALGVVEECELPDDPNDPQWAHLLVEATTAVSHDRPAVLHDHADLAGLLPSLVSRATMVDPSLASLRPSPANDGDTTYLCTTDRNGMGVSLINSNASGFGSLLVEPSTGINLHNRGLGFSVAAGHQLPGSLVVPLASFPAGDYRLEIKVTDKPSGRTVTQNAAFTVTQ